MAADPVTPSTRRDARKPRSPTPTRVKLAAWLASLRDDTPDEGKVPSANGSHPPQVRADAPQALAEVTKARGKKQDRSAGLLIRLTAEEQLRIVEITDRVGLSLESYARWKMLGEKPPRPLRRASAGQEELVPVLAQVEKVKRDLAALIRRPPAKPIERNDFGEVMGDLDTLKDAVLEILAKQLRSSSSEGNGR